MRASLLPAMQAVDPDTYIEFDHLSTLPGFDDDGRNAIADIGRACSDAHDDAQGVVRHRGGAVPRRVDAGRDLRARHIEQAHQPNEWVSLEQLARCEAFMQRLAQHLCLA